jgi:uncharacterized phage-like protein YoqJ
MILAITGHRPPSLGGYNIPNPTYDKIMQALEGKFKELKPEKIISGMALGTDQWAAEMAMKLGIPFIAAVPCDGQDSKWPEESKRKYKTILDSAVEVVVVSPGPYAPDKMHTRDRWMVDHSNELLAVWSGIRHGGTFGTIRYAEKQQNKSRPEYKIHVINPTKLG